MEQSLLQKQVWWLLRTRLKKKREHVILECRLTARDKRGFASLNGVVVAISTSNLWKANHVTEYSANYAGSAPRMETEGAMRIFKRSVEKHGMRYVKYYGDGDSKSFEKVEHIYPGVVVKKMECIGHYQKRVGNRLRKLRARTKGLGGKNKVKKCSQ